MNHRNAIGFPVFHGMTLRTHDELSNVCILICCVLAQKIYQLGLPCLQSRPQNSGEYVATAHWKNVSNGPRCLAALVARNWVMGDEDDEESRVLCHKFGAPESHTMHCQDESCPLCMQTLDETDISFFACPCNYQAIETCHQFLIRFW